MPSPITRKLVFPIKDPNAKVAYELDWSRYLIAGDVISAAVVTGDGVAVDTSNFTDTTTTVVLSGGTVNTLASVHHRVTTAQGLIEERTVYVQIGQQ